MLNKILIEDHPIGKEHRFTVAATHLGLRGDRRLGVWVDRGLGIVALRGEIPGAEAPFQVIDIGGEGLPEAAERNGGAVGGGAAILAAVGNLAGSCLRRPFLRCATSGPRHLVCKKKIVFISSNIVLLYRYAKPWRKFKNSKLILGTKCEKNVFFYLYNLIYYKN